MIDYVNVRIFSHQFKTPILENPLLEFEQNIVQGEIKSQKSKYKNLEVFVQGNQVTISGSLHKFWNGNDTNWNDFPYWAVRQTIIDLSNNLGFNPKDARVLGLEHGVNIVCTSPVKSIISRTICYDWREPFESMKGIVGKGNGKQANLSNYRVKIYDKGLQHSVHNLLRVENKTLRSIDLEGTGVITLWDLTKVDVLERLGHRLLNRFGDVLIVEDIDQSSLNTKQKLLYHDSKNPNYWKELARWKRNDMKQLYLDLIEKYGTSGIKNDLHNDIFNKWEELRKCNVFAWFSERLLENNCNVFAWLEEPSISAEEMEICNVLSLLKLQNVTHCLVTGFDISGQKVGSKFVSEKTVKENPELAKKLEEGRRCYQRKDNGISEAARLAKRTRNSFSNRGNNTRAAIIRLKSKGELMLFSLEETIASKKWEEVERFKGTKWEITMVQNEVNMQVLA